MIGMGKIYERNEEVYRNGLAFRAGLSKGVRIILNDEGKDPVPALVADGTYDCSKWFSAVSCLVKKSVFYREELLSDTVAQYFSGHQVDWREFLHLYKGVRCYLTYAPSRSVVIFGLTDENEPIGSVR